MHSFFENEHKQALIDKAEKETKEPAEEVKRAEQKREIIYTSNWQNRQS